MTLKGPSLVSHYHHTGAFEGIFGPDSNEDHTGAWDSVMTCFFIDTVCIPYLRHFVILNRALQAKNFVHHLRIIHSILAPGGVWINLGPLLWHWENSDELSIELTLDEVKELARGVGFELSVCCPLLPGVLLASHPIHRTNDLLKRSIAATRRPCCRMYITLRSGRQQKSRLRGVDPLSI